MSKKEVIKRVHILVGIPGSGKTTWAKSKGSSRDLFRKNEIKVWHFDELISSRKTFDRVLKEVIDSIDGYKTINEHVLDGLFLTHEIQARIVHELKDKNVEIIFHYWEPDIEACLWNDRYRRGLNSSTTISHAIIDKPIKSDKVKVENHITKRKDSFQMFKDKYNLKDELRSSEWSLGGAYGNCYDNEMRSVSGEAPLSSFEEFDNLMEEISSNMTFLQYKKIYNHCVSSDTRYESDYYGGGITYGFYKCDIYKLYEILVEKDIIDENL